MKTVFAVVAVLSFADGAPPLTVIQNEVLFADKAACVAASQDEAARITRGGFIRGLPTAIDYYCAARDDFPDETPTRDGKSQTVTHRTDKEK